MLLNSNEIHKYLPPEVGRERLEVYREGYTGRLFDIMQSDYPVLCKYMGYEEFKELCYAYIASYPSQDYALFDLGKELSLFLKQSSMNQKFLLSELAYFERALNQVAFVADFPSVLEEDLRVIVADDWPKLIFKAAPGVQVFNLNYSVPHCFETDNVNECHKVINYHIPHSWLVWRHDLTAHFRSVSSIETTLLSQIEQEYCISDLCEYWSDFYPEQDVVELVWKNIAKWISLGLLTEFQVS